MSEVPHCPDCGRADTVTPRRGPGYEYYCDNCDRVIQTSEITDAAFIDMVSRSMFRDPDQIEEQAEKDFFSDKCECEWCERGRPGLEEF